MFLRMQGRYAYNYKKAISEYGLVSSMIQLTSTNLAIDLSIGTACVELSHGAIRLVATHGSATNWDVSCAGIAGSCNLTSPSDKTEPIEFGEM